MPLRRRAAGALSALVVSAVPALAQATDPSLAAARRGLALLDSAIVAHGGVARIRAIEDFTMRSRGRRWMAYQSRTLARPWVTQPTWTDVVLDFKSNRLRREGYSRYPVDFVFGGVNVSTPQGGAFWDPGRVGLGDAIIRFPAQQAATSPLRRELPAFQVLGMRDRPETVRWAGERTEGGRRWQGVTYAEPNGGVYTVWFDAATKRLARLDWVRDDGVDGDVAMSYEYSGWRDEKGVPVPTRLVERRNGELSRDDTLDIAIDTKPAESVFALPASGYADSAATPQGPETEPIRKLAENVWLLQRLPGGNRVMFVAFRDHVLVLETPTPQSAATAVMDAVRRTVPGRPIRYAAFTHHHDDHAGGLRPYIADGVTIVTTPTNRAFVEHVARATHALRPDTLSRAPRAPVIETFTKKRVFTDGDMTVELHDVGPTSHVDELVMAYLPKEKLIFQGDLLILPDRGEPGPAITLAREFLAAIERLKLDVETIAGVHGPVGTMAQLRAAVGKAK